MSAWGTRKARRLRGGFAREEGFSGKLDVYIVAGRGQRKKEGKVCRELFSLVEVLRKRHSQNEAHG